MSTDLTRQHIFVLCWAVGIVFLLAGWTIDDAARSISLESERQFEQELLATTHEIRQTLLSAAGSLPFLADQPTMGRILDLDEEDEIQRSLQRAGQSVDFFTRITCVDHDGEVVASTEEDRLRPGLGRRARRFTNVRETLVEPTADGVRLTVPVFFELEVPEQIGALEGIVSFKHLLSGDHDFLVTLSTESGQVLAEARASETTREDVGPELKTRSNLLRFPPEVIVDQPLVLTVAIPHDTLFGRSESLRTRIVWVGIAVAASLLVIGFTFLRVESRHRNRSERHARELEAKNEELEASTELLSVEEPPARSGPPGSVLARRSDDANSLRTSEEAQRRQRGSRRPRAGRGFFNGLAASAGRARGEGPSPGRRAQAFSIWM